LKVQANLPLASADHKIPGDIKSKPEFAIEPVRSGERQIDVFNNAGGIGEVDREDMAACFYFDTQTQRIVIELITI
jgi:hypothetical protein